MVRSWLAFVALAVLSLSGAAAAASPPVEAYGKLPAIEDISLSPSGQRYAFIVVAGETRKLVAASVEGDTPLLTSDVGSAKVVDVGWAGEDHLLVTVNHTVPLGWGYTVSKAEMATVIVLNLKTGKAFNVFDKHPTVTPVVNGRFGVAQVGGRWFGYFGGITYVFNAAGEGSVDHTWPDLYQVDLDSGAISLAAKGGKVDNWLVGPDGQVIARSTYDALDRTWMVVSDAIGGRVLASGKSDFGSVDLLGRGRTADTVLVSEPSGHDAILQELPLSGAAGGKAAAGLNTEETLFDPVSGLWIGSISEGDPPETVLFDAMAQARVAGALKPFKGRRTVLTSYTADLGRQIIETSGAGDSGTYWLVDMAAHSARPVGYERPEIVAGDVGPIDMVDWTAADGLALRGVLSLPPGRDPKNLPLVVMPHGGPEARDYPGFDWWAQLFASRGYAVFQPNFRGSTGYGVKLHDAGFGQWGRKMQTDVSDGVAALAARGVVDPKRACIVGWSYGGYAALAGVTLQHGHYRCAVSMAGVSDPGGMLDFARDRADGVSSPTERFWKAFMGVTSTWSGELKAISPIDHASEADAPILLIHGKDDTIVPVAQSLAMARALKGAGKPVDLLTLPGGDHPLLREDTRLAMARASLDFVLKYDPPDPEPAP